MFVPERVTTLMLPPVKPPWVTSYGAMATRNSLTASSEIGCVPEEPPGDPELSRPKASFSAAPSTWMLL